MPFSYKSIGVFDEYYNENNSFGEMVNFAAQDTYINFEIKDTKEKDFLDQFKEYEEISDEEWDLDEDDIKKKKDEYIKKEVAATVGTLRQAEALEKEYAEQHFIRLEPKKRFDDHGKEIEEGTTKMFKDFYKIYGEELRVNQFWQINLFDCVEYLKNKEKTNDEIFDNILNSLDGNFDACQYL